MSVIAARNPDGSDLAPELLARFSHFVAEAIGLHFPENRWRTLEQGVVVAARRLGFPDTTACIRGLISAPLTGEVLETLAGCLTIGETYFWREEKSLSALGETILPELIRTRNSGEQTLRIWSAGCSTGEEAYSIAILLDRMGATLRDWKVRVIATDINAQSLQRAREGVYGAWSFRNTTPEWLKSRYFTAKPAGRLEIIPRIKKLVHFSCLNLVEDAYPSLLTDTNALDVIFCRNVLMYFTPECANQVIERFRQSLREGGWLVVSPCEAAGFRFVGFAASGFPEVTLYRKEEAQDRSGEAKREVGGREAELRPLPPCCPAPTWAETPPRLEMATPLPVLSPLQPSLYEQARSLCAQGDYAAAAVRADELLAQNPRDTLALALRCRIFANAGELAEALHTSEAALAVDRLDARLHYLRGVILQEKGEITAAIAALKKALYLDQDLILAHFILGNLTLRQGKVSEARRHFANALTLLERCGPDELLPESEGMSAARLTEIIGAITGGLPAQKGKVDG